ncbi:TetR/AcrR family transcriptional regulator [Marinimicrobium alkaliphilum]|uniref:TetR/AcrR family transcriptional regulator n=1 Tax=Marinimicrobium alkaliphilum TaxID=2202654 RepID=UPI000DBA088E|nr:TetR/AcrR family transcriptional regulator [Marinimicrobium alkaliphilum]
MTAAVPSASNDKRAAILDSALFLLANRGFHGFSIKRLAEGAGVAVGTIYLYFKDREDVINQLHGEIIRHVAGKVFVDHDTSLPLDEQYRRMVRNLWQFCVDNPETLYCKSQFDNLPPHLQRSQREDSHQIFEPLLVLYAKGREAGIIRDLSDDVLSGLAIEPCFFLVRQHLRGFIDITDEMRDTIIAASWRAISP